MRRGVAEYVLEEVRRYDAGAARRVQRVECCENGHAVGVAERRLDDGEAVLRRRKGRCADQGRASRRSVARERGGEERDGRIAEPPNRGCCTARIARLLERCDDPTLVLP